MPTNKLKHGQVMFRYVVGLRNFLDSRYYILLLGIIDIGFYTIYI
jgi:hypothetical protein